MFQDPVFEVFIEIFYLFYFSHSLRKMSIKYSS